MKNLFLLFTLVLLLNCSSDNEPEVNTNLIANSTFENGNEFNFQYWNGNLTTSNTDVPSNGENYSLQIQPGWAPDEGYAETSIIDLEGAVSLNFSCDVKAIDWTGKIIILKEDVNGNRTEISNTSFNNAEWQNIEFNINTNLVNRDLLIIRLSAGITEVTSGKVLFDNIVVVNN